MQELTTMIMNYGASTIIVALFLWDWAVNKKKTNEILEELRISNMNMTKSLEILHETVGQQYNLLIEHDKKAIEINESLKTIKSGWDAINNKFNERGKTYAK